MRPTSPDSRKPPSIVCGYSIRLDGSPHIQRTGQRSAFVPDAFGREWHLAQSHTGGVENRVGQGSRHRNGGQFPGAGRLDVGLINEHGFDVGHICKRQNRICAPIQTGDVRLVELHSLEETTTDSLKNSTLDLVPEPLRIDDSSAGYRDYDLRNANAPARSIDFDVCNDRRACFEAVLAEGDPAAREDGGLAVAAPGRWPGLPAGFLDGGVQHAQHGRILNMVTTELDRVHLLVSRNFIQERFDGEVALYASGRPKVNRPEKLFDEVAQHPRVGK